MIGGKNFWQSRFLDWEKQEWNGMVFCRKPWGGGREGMPPLLFCPLFVRLFTKGDDVFGQFSRVFFCESFVLDVLSILAWVLLIIVQARSSKPSTKDAPQEWDELSDFKKEIGPRNRIPARR